jgi:hypothetical protein
LLLTMLALGFVGHWLINQFDKAYMGRYARKSGHAWWPFEPRCAPFVGMPAPLSGGGCWIAKLPHPANTPDRSHNDFD